MITYKTENKHPNASESIIHNNPLNFFEVYFYVLMIKKYINVVCT